ncbi:thioredoxin domain-containing protein [Sulfitobacter sp. KE29]|jgi:protein-disulfide isomerase|uniref:Protein-disulfide isomerase n=1 Tax=Sulfitobacter delicatus TaxID=218672 RepID=A0A1G7WY56_9RHOB|nr:MULTISPECIES: DsbA family protein [Roseobacteraceae]SDG76835.1 Protein-disulfide isomerase [Sulfitobacter delicatus]MDF3419557.1 thioredoxin domain-containing protein [Sulfitobacter sp. Ks38]MDF3427039.1 thioredoxin domain-containing protein [Sulfitobacter sp. KE29]MDF3430621.1 thioredoxin domain-containing protein [Sulfitobacter sp. S46]MDF3445393.1 thioredoxin domain-containing protein [Sulfitobacter sp. KE31]
MILKTALRVFAVFLWALISTPTISLAQQSTPLDQVEQEAIKALILQTIRENPEVLVDTLLAFQEEAQAQAQAEQRAAIQRVGELLLADANTGVMGNPEGDIVVVEFFDYNCPYCRRAAPVLFELIEENPDLRIIVREWPILGPDSELAARASLAAIKQNGFEAFHDALMAQPRANAVFIRRAAEQAGLDYDQLQADMDAPEVDAHIAKSHDLARQLGISGTPTFLIGETLVPGLLEKADLQALIAEAGDVD